jgi:hypothetical protein
MSVAEGHGMASNQRRWAGAGIKFGTVADVGDVDPPVLPRRGCLRTFVLSVLVKHIEGSKTTGCKLEELYQVLPALSTTQVQSLLRTLKRLGKAHAVGQRKAGVWYAGPSPDTDSNQRHDA